MEELKDFVPSFKQEQESMLNLDNVVPMICASYNFMPNEHSKQTVYMFMFGNDPVTPLSYPSELQIRY